MTRSATLVKILGNRQENVVNSYYTPFESCGGAAAFGTLVPDREIGIQFLWQGF